MNKLIFIPIFLAVVYLYSFKAFAFPMYQTPLDVEELVEQHPCNKVTFDEKGINTYMYFDMNVATCYNNKTNPPTAISLFLKSTNCSYVVKTFPETNCPANSINPALHFWNSDTNVVHLNRLPVCSISIPLFENQIRGEIAMEVNFGFGPTRITSSSWDCINFCDKFTTFRYPNTLKIHPVRHITGHFNVKLYSRAGCRDKIAHINSNFVREAMGLLDLTEVTRLPEMLSYQIFRY